MIRLIFHQIWNQRRQNLWIWLELAVLSAFLWTAIDPLFTMVCIKHIPKGFEYNKIYFVKPVYRFPHGNFTARDANNFAARMEHLFTQLEAYHMVDAVCLGDIGQIPGGYNWNCNTFYRTVSDAKTDAAKDWSERVLGSDAQFFEIPYITGLEKWIDVPYVLGLRDALSGTYVHAQPDAMAQRLTYMSAGMARRLYGTPNVKDSTVLNGFPNADCVPSQQEIERDRMRKIDAVYTDVKGRDYEVPFPTLFIVEDCNDKWISQYGALIRLKDGVDGEKFMKDVQRDVLQNCCIDPILRFKVISLKQKVDEDTELVGANNVVRLQAALGFFGLLCVFLGVSGLFWVRCGERRQDIGVMRSLGATRRMANRQMLLEGALLLSAAFLPAMMFVLWHVRTNGYDMGLTEEAVVWQGPDFYYWFNRPVPHILAVTLITYALMLFITLLATWLPVHRATRILPSDALRDE